MAFRADETPTHRSVTPLVDENAARLSPIPLLFPQSVADVEDMEDGAFEDRGALSAAAARPKAGGRTRRPSRLRVVATPEPAIAQLLAHLGLRLPKGAREISNVVPKTGG